MTSIKNKAIHQVLKRTIRGQFYPGVDFAQMRTRVERMDGLLKRLDRGFSRERFSFEAFELEWIRPDGVDSEHVFLYFHGGGFCISTPSIHGQLLAELCKHSQCVGLMPDYRLAPDHVYPAALEDCLNSYLWLLDQGKKPSEIVLGGDSAGGNLTLAVLHKLRQKNLPMPACAVVLSPGLDLRHTGESMKKNAEKDSVISPAAIQAFSEAYVPGPLKEELITEIDAMDFSGFPPLLIQVGSNEILLDDAHLAHTKALAGNVEVVLEVYEDMPHVFQLLNMLPESRQAKKRISDFICTQLSPRN